MLNLKIMLPAGLMVFAQKDAQRAIPTAHAWRKMDTYANPRSTALRRQ
jgi:hypothetical protein